MPHLTVGLGALTSPAGAYTVCGYLSSEAGNSGVARYGGNLRVNIYSCGSGTEIINTSKYSANVHCIDFSNINLTSENSDYRWFELDGCQYNQPMCMVGEYFVHHDDKSGCNRCSDNKSGLPMRDYFQDGMNSPESTVQFHQNTSCNYCITGYYKSGNDCVSCPENNLGEGGVMSWGDGGIDTCFVLQMAKSSEPVQEGSDISGTYEISRKIFTLDDIQIGGDYIICEYKQ